ncbi:hypothetical protein [Ruegeria arenilitoris]|uniref:hypothetical protein n=1 Tax=Ruegeria arenilitoris TaxID=1173585 RepID=UPI003C7A15C2
MRKVGIEHLQAALTEAGIELSESVVFPYGLRIGELDGKKVVIPLTPDEYRESLAKIFPEEEARKQALNPRCVSSGAFCVSQGCTSADGECYKYFDTDRWLCGCSY